MYPQQAKFNYSTTPKTITNFNSLFRFVKLAGIGGFSQLFKIEDKKSGKKYALKVLKEVDKDTDTEIGILLHLSKNKAISNDIVKYYDYFIFNHKNVILLEFLEGQSAFDYFHTHNVTLDKVIHFGKWLFTTLAKLHALDIVHRDIKPDNIFVTNHGYKLIDFGFSCKMTRNFNDPLKCDNHIKGTLKFIAPELYQHSKDFKPADVYSAGMTLYVILSNYKFPYLYDQQERISDSRYIPIRFKPQFQFMNTILQRLVSVGPKSRPTAKEAIKLLQ